MKPLSIPDTLIPGLIEQILNDRAIYIGRLIDKDGRQLYANGDEGMKIFSSDYKGRSEANVFARSSDPEVFVCDVVYEGKNIVANKRYLPHIKRLIELSDQRLFADDKGNIRYEDTLEYYRNKTSGDPSRMMSNYDIIERLPDWLSDIKKRLPWLKAGFYSLTEDGHHYVNGDWVATLTATRLVSFPVPLHPDLKPVFDDHFEHVIFFASDHDVSLAMTMITDHPDHAEMKKMLFFEVLKRGEQ